jgi:hypothetical protein
MRNATPEQIVAFMTGGKMPDIVARLRSRSPYLNGSSAERTMEEAAAVIERLRAVNKRYRQLSSFGMMGNAAEDAEDEAMTQREYPIIKEVHDLRAEVERLRTEQDKAWTKHLIEREDLKAEVKRLRVAADNAMDILEVMDVHIDDPFYKRVIRTMKRLSHALENKA